MKNIKNAITGFIALALIFGAAPVAQAQTAADFQAQIAALLAQVQALTAQLNAQGGATVTGTFTMNLTLGSTGAQVLSLQRFLNANGYVVATVGAGSPGNETSYFGPATRAATARFQAAKNISPAVGYFGPITRAAVNAMLGATVGSGGAPGGGTTPTPTPTPSDDLEGGAGSINDADFISGLNNEEVGEGQEDVEVAGLEIEADDGSDIMLTAVRLVFVKTSAGAGSSDDFEDYADEVSLWFDGEEVARVDGDEFDDDNAYSRTISLDEGAIIRMDEVEELVVAVSGINNLDSDDAGETWTVEVDTVRFRDAQGAIISDTATGDIGATRGFSFEVFATSADLELQVSLGDEEINDAHVINVHATNDTDNVELLSFEIEIEGSSDVTIDEIPVEITTGGMNIDDAVITAYLYADGEEIGSENITATDTDETIVFDDLDYTIDAGDTVEFIVMVDLNSLSAVVGAEVAEGDTIQAQITAVERALIDAEDESGEDVAAADMTGTAVADAHAIYDVGFNIAFVSATETKTTTADPATVGSADQGQFVIKYDITAFDGDVYIDNTCVEDNDGGEVSTATSYSVTNDGSNTTICVLTSTADVDAATAFLVEEGQTERFTLTVSVTATADAFAQVSLEAIGWDDAAGGDDNVFDFDLPGDFETDPLTLNIT